MTSESTAKLAVLIDADNAQPKMVSLLLAEIAKYGTAFVKRAYGDWTTPNMNGWKEQLLANSIQPIQQFAYTYGKNSTDAAMVIDAMDLLYTNRFDGFCIVSSDSDFTRLASRIRESGLVVYGFGERKTPKPLVTACDKFIYTENLVPKPDRTENSVSKPDNTSSPQPQAGTKRPHDSISKADSGYMTQAQHFIHDAIMATSDDDGWTSLASLGSIILKWRPDFDPRTYGYDKLKHLLEADPSLEVEARFPGPGKPPVIYARIKKPRIPMSSNLQRHSDGL